MKPALVILLFYTTTMGLYAQPTNLKLNLPSLPFNNISLMGERVISENQSFSFGVGYHFPKGSLRGGNNNDGFMYNLNGFFITPEYRFYMGGDAPSGLYVAPYLRYMHLGSHWNGRYQNDSVTWADYQVNTKLSEFGFGLQGGFQYVSDKGLSLDFFLIGPRFSFYSFKAIFNGDVNEQAVFDIIGIKGLDENGYYGIGKSLFEKIGNAAKLRIPLSFFALRAGFAVGYVF